MNENEPTCFIIMPITTPPLSAGTYKGDRDHFMHVLQHLFEPAVKAAGLKPIPPNSSGSDIIQAEIIKNLSTADLVLCDMSILNPNVFFEFGIRTALNKPVALVADDKTQSIPFDTSIVNFLRYDSSLSLWAIKKEVENLCDHIKAAFEKTKTHNALWKHFGKMHAIDEEENSIANLALHKVSELRQEMDNFKRTIYVPMSQEKLTPLTVPEKQQEIDGVDRIMDDPIQIQHKDIKQAAGIERIIAWTRNYLRHAKQVGARPPMNPDDLLSKFIHENDAWQYFDTWPEFKRAFDAALKDWPDIMRPSTQ